jgi:hypothetical protein
VLAPQPLRLPTPTTTRWPGCCSLARDDVVLLHSDLVDNVQGMLDVLMGLNRIYAPHPWHKWSDYETGLLGIAPADMNLRIRSLLRAESRAAADEATALPEFDTAEKRTNFDEHRVVPHTPL